MSTFRIQTDGDGKGRDLAVVDWKTGSGEAAGEVKIPITGLGRIGPISVMLHAAGDLPNAYEWDTREWQWWKDYPFDLNQMRPREVAPASGGADFQPGGMRVWSRFNCDEVETTQQWFFHDLESTEQAVYDCLITVHNHRDETLEEYGQFFASYTSWNGRKGHLYWSEEGSLVNYQQAGSRHLDYYVAQAGSMFHRLGKVPHCPRGEGKVRATWKHPVSISLPNPRGYRHVLLTEEARTSAIAQGMQGLAQDFLIYPPAGRLKARQTFSVHVRHLIVEASDETLTDKLPTWWAAFVEDHQRVHRLAREVSTSKVASPAKRQ